MTIAALVLAAGQSRRMGGPNKLLEQLDGVALVRRVADAALAARLDPVIVVTGFDADAVAAALHGLTVRLVDNPDFAAGLAGSLRRGLAAVPQDADGAMVLLGDMPLVTPGVLRRLLAAFEAEPGGLAAVPIHDGQWGNPVILARALFAQAAALQGDAGARKLLESDRESVIEVPISDPAVITDVDTPQALARLRAAPD